MLEKPHCKMSISVTCSLKPETRFSSCKDNYMNLVLEIHNNSTEYVNSYRRTGDVMSSKFSGASAIGHAGARALTFESCWAWGHHSADPDDKKDLIHLNLWQ
jgi:hypothetical protein